MLRYYEVTPYQVHLGMTTKLQEVCLSGAKMVTQTGLTVSIGLWLFWRYANHSLSARETASARLSFQVTRRRQFPAGRTKEGNPSMGRVQVTSRDRKGLY